MTRTVQFLRRTGLSAAAPAWIAYTALAAILFRLLFSVNATVFLPLPFVLIALLDPEGVAQGQSRHSPLVTAGVGLAASTLGSVGMISSGLHLWPTARLSGAGMVLLGLLLLGFSALLGFALLRTRKRGGT